MQNLKGKKLLILGGGSATVNVVQQARKMGLYTIVTSYEPHGQAWDIADEHILVGSEEHDKLIEIIKAKHIDGVMTGSAEFQIKNMIQLCEKAGLNCYATQAQWDATQDKRNFKDLIKEYGVPGVPEFGENDVLNDVDFPVIVKPVDGCSSIGINVCRNNAELESAKKLAMDASSAKRIIIERYIENGGLTHVIKYVAVNGKCHMEMMGDRYVLNKGLITAVSFFPSISTDVCLRDIDPKVDTMFDSIGFHNGVFFFQAIPDGSNIFIYEMGLRTGGGMNYKLTECTSGNNDLEMLIHYAVTGSMCDEEDLSKIDPYLKGKSCSSMAFPLRTGTIMSVHGFDKLSTLEGVVNFSYFYNVGDVIRPEYINTLRQLYGRVMVVKDTKPELMAALKSIRDEVSVLDENGEEMIIWDTFDELYQKFMN